MKNTLTRILSAIVLLILCAVAMGQDGITPGQIYPLSRSTVPRIRAVSNVSAFNSNTALTNGTTQTSSTDDFAFYTFAPATDFQFLFLNGNFAGGSTLLNPVGSAITFKACLYNNGNYCPLSFDLGSSGSTITSPAQSGISTTVNGAATSASQTLTAIPQGCVVGASLHFATANVTYPVVSIASNVVTLTTSFTSTNSEVVTVVAQQGTGNILGDAQYTWSKPASYYLASGQNILRIFWSKSAGQFTPQFYTRGYFGGSGGAWRSSDKVNGGTTDGADYSNGPSGSPGYGGSSQAQWGAGLVVARQLSPYPVLLIVGDSIGYGTAQTGGQGYIGTAFDAAGIRYVNCSFGGSTVANQSRYTTVLAEIAHKFCDGIIGHITTNDFFNAEPFAQVQTAYLQYVQNLSAGGAPYWATTCLPRTTSSDNWATAANQTVSAYEPTRIQWNNWLRDTSANGASTYFKANLIGLARLGGIFDVTPGFEQNSSGTYISGSNLTQTTYNFTLGSSSVTAGATYSDGLGHTFTTGPTTSSATSLVCTSPSSSGVLQTGTLTLQTGTGTSPITYTAVTQSSPNQQGFGTFGRYLTNGTGLYYTSDGIHPKATANAILDANLTNLVSTFGSLYSTTIGDRDQLFRDCLSGPRQPMPSLIASVNSVNFGSLAPR